MAIDTKGGAPVSLTVFGSLVTETSPAALPEGVSPDCQDVEFVPGSVFSRRCLSKVFATPFGSVTVSYAKSFVQPNGDIQNLYLDAAGNIWHEDASNLPGSYTLLQAVQANTYGKSITAFGKEYIAISDGLHGADMPLQWDGTNLDRVTQDGPGVAPTVANLVIPPVAMAATGSAPTLTITGVFPDQKVNGYWTTINIYTSSGAGTVAVGSLVFISGTGSAFDSALPYLVILNPGPGGAITCQAYFPGSQSSYVGGGTLTIGTTGITLTRQGNYVTCNTAAAHNLKPGYQVQISGASASSLLPPLAVGGGITQIVINNENAPGLATITTSSAHGLIPGNQVILNSIGRVAIGGSVTGITWAGGVAQIQMASPHGLSPGAQVTIQTVGAGGAPFNMATTVLSVISTLIFTYAMTPLGSASPGPYTGSSSDFVYLSWPVPNTTTPTYFEVVSAPSPTTFQVQINYSDSTFTSGQVSFPWEGTFFVSSVPSSTSFVYKHIGPNGTSNTVGQVTPYGQCAPGQHQCQVLFLTRQGYITRPSPPTTFQANGGQYVSVSNIPIGPPNVVARILAFTGAGGTYFFYIPVNAQINGQIVARGDDQAGTASGTVVYDNTSTAAVLDFSDNTLFSSLGISIPGNTPANNIVIDGALGFGFYGNRLVTWGQRNRVQNLLNMGFEGGVLPTGGTSGSPINQPCGWTINTTGGTVVAGHITGNGWQMGNAQGTIKQSLYQDAYGAPIAQPNTFYAFRAWLSAPATVTITISSASTAFSTTCSLIMVGFGGYVQSGFPLATPGAIPPDLVITIAANAAVMIDELSLIYEQNPWLDSIMYASYANNPEAFDGVSGKLGSTQDAHKVMDVASIRQTLYFLTQDPGGKLHQTSDNGTTEPAGWTVNQVGANCGVLSAFALTKSQADDSSAAAGEEWFAWLSATGPRIFGGDFPYKIGQEIQPDFNSVATSTIGLGIGGTLLTAGLTCWALNEISTKTLFFGVPITVPGTPGTYPNRIYACSYRELDTAYQIATSGPIHTSFTGKLVATDHTRKWTRWNMTMNGAALMYHPDPAGGAGLTQLMTLFAGNGSLASGGFGNVYTLSATKFTDDDYGQVAPYYTTYFFVSHEQEAQLSYQLANGQRQPLGSGRKLLQYLSAFISTPAGFNSAPPNRATNLTISFLVDSLTNVWPITALRVLTDSPTHDLECGAGSAQGQRIAVRFSTAPASPVTTKDNGFQISHLTVWLRQARVPIRGAV